MSTSKSLKRAKQKWESKNEQITIRVPKGKRKLIQQYAKKKGKSVNQFIAKLIDNEISK